MAIAYKKNSNELPVLLFVFDVHMQNMSSCLGFSIHLDSVTGHSSHNFSFNLIYQPFKIHVHAEIHISAIRDNTSPLSPCYQQR